MLDEEQGGTVVVDPLNHNKFCMDVEQVVKACTAYNVGLKFYQQLEDLQERLNAWVLDNRHRLHGAFISYRAGGELLFVAVQAGIERDPELASRMTDLDIEIASSEQFDELNLEVLSLPKSSRAPIFGRIIVNCGMIR